MTISLPWPPSQLNPNVRSHWAVKAKFAKQYKHDCIWLLRPHYEAIAGKNTFTFTFCPPDKRRRDDDNIISAFKAGRDGLSYITGVDDSKFVVTYAMGEPVKGGAVIVEAA